MDLLSSLNEDLRNTIEEITATSKFLGIKAYLVGGAVRDCLLNIMPKDIDICIEGNPRYFIENLQNIKSFLYYEDFMTSTINFKNGYTVDIICCRKEKYKNNGDLPIIEPSDIEHDLYRRDFTINSLAYDLWEKKIIDLYNGVQDLKTGIIKKIHPLSYEEDPTRILRAARYSGRLGFELFDQEEIKDCVEKNFMNTISNDRFMNEIKLILMESSWIDCVEMLKLLHIINISMEDLKIKGDNSSLNWKISICFYLLQNENIKEKFINNSVLPKLIKQNLKIYYENSSKIIDELSRNHDNFEIYTCLHGLPEGVLDILKLHKELYYIINNYIINLRHFTMPLDGNELISIGISKGKNIKKTLQSQKKIILNTLLEIDSDRILKLIGDKDYGS